MTDPTPQPAPTPAPSTPAPSPSPSPSPSSAPAPAASKWYEAAKLAPEDVGYLQTKKWDGEEGPAALYKNYRQLETHIGVPPERLLKLPEKPDDAESWGKVYDRLGRPESPDKYDYKPPEGARIDAERMKWFSGIAHKAGLSKAQMHALAGETVNFENAMLAEAQKALDIQQAGEIESLKKEWGPAYTERQELARRAVRAFVPSGSDEELQQLEGALGSAKLLKLFASIGEKLGEDKMPQPSGTRPFGYTPEQAASDKAALMIDLKKDPVRRAEYAKNRGPDYDKMQSLIKILAAARGK